MFLRKNKLKIIENQISYRDLQKNSFLYLKKQHSFFKFFFVILRLEKVLGNCALI